MKVGSSTKVVVVVKGCDEGEAKIMLGRGELNNTRRGTL